MLLAFTGSSQVLTPVVNVSVSDTVFCFNQNQCRILATHLVKGQYCDSILQQTEQELKKRQELDSMNQRSICLLEEQARNYQCIVSEQDSVATVLTKQIQDCNKQLRRQRWQNRFLKTGCIIVSSLSIVGFIAVTR